MVPTVFLCQQSSKFSLQKSHNNYRIIAAEMIQYKLILFETVSSTFYGKDADIKNDERIHFYLMPISQRNKEL